MKGCIHVAGDRNGSYSADYLAPMARYFDVDENKLADMFNYIEEAELPTLMLIQKAGDISSLAASCVISSAWSKSYEKVGNPYGRIHRDYHYQILFSAMAALAEIGCEELRVESLCSGFSWKRDAYICLREAWTNIRKYVNPKLKISLQSDALSDVMFHLVNMDLEKYGLEAHRPIGIHMYIENGFNFRKIFL